MGEVGFWGLHCPARPGNDLLHRHARDCTDGHAIDQCCECGYRASEWRPPVALVAAPVSVADRLRDIGVGPDPRDQVLVEPKMITGHGPQGPKEGPRVYGRGADLTPLDMQRLLFHIYVVRVGHD